VKKRLARWLFGLYRPTTRQRYRADFEALIDDLSASDAVRWGLVDVAVGGCRDRLHGRRPAGLVVAAGALVLAVAFVVTIWSGSPAAKAPASSSSITLSTLLAHPVELPGVPRDTAGTCPDPPALASELPPDAVISAPGLVPSSMGALTVLGGTYQWPGRCEYTITFSS
jgi:hypothetical protein